MLADIYPLQVLLMTFSGLVNRHQADVIAYLVEEKRVLREQMKGRTDKACKGPVRPSAGHARGGGPAVCGLTGGSSALRWPVRCAWARAWTADRAHGERSA